MPRAVAGRDEKQAMKATAKACIREALRNQEVLTSAPWEEFTKEKELVLIDGMAKYKLAFNRATQSESIPDGLNFDDPRYPKLMKHALEEIGEDSNGQVISYQRTNRNNPQTLST